MELVQLHLEKVYVSCRSPLPNAYSAVEVTSTGTAAEAKGELNANGTFIVSTFAKRRILLNLARFVLHVSRIVLAMIFMLVFMVFDYALAASIISGRGVGFIFFRNLKVFQPEVLVPPQDCLC
jgi:hypothetical protein